MSSDNSPELSDEEDFYDDFDSNTFTVPTEEDLNCVSQEEFQNKAEFKELKNIFSTYSLSKKEAIRVKSEQLYLYYVMHGGLAFFPTWKLYLMDILAERLKNPLHRKIWKCSSKWPEAFIIERCDLQQSEIKEGVKLKDEVHKAKQSLNKIFKREHQSVMRVLHDKNMEVVAKSMTATTGSSRLIRHTRRWTVGSRKWLPVP
jgi:hypothetical protein